MVMPCIFLPSTQEHHDKSLLTNVDWALGADEDFT